MDRWQTRTDVPAGTSGPALARQLVAIELAAWGLGHLAADAQLLVSELVTNAYQHAPGTESYELEISADDECVRLSLADGSIIRPAMRDFSSTKLRGRGIRIVDAIASRWGTEDYPGGKRVWAELACTSRARAVMS